METQSGVPAGDQAAGAEQKIDSGIDFAAQCAKMFGFGAVAGEVEPLAMVGVHLGFAISHLFSHFGKKKPAAQPPAQPAAPTPAASTGQPQ